MTTVYNFKGLLEGMQFLADKLAKEQLPLLALIEGCDALHE